MGANVYLEIFGYIGTAVVILSMMMHSMTKLRALNITGSVITLIYALICKTYPVALLNAVLVGVNLYHLIKYFVGTSRGSTDGADADNGASRSK